MIENKQKNLSRYIRDKSAFSDFVINDKDRQTIKLVYSHRFLSTNLLWQLLKNNESSLEQFKIGKDGKKRPLHYGFSKNALYKRLQGLFHSQYLARHYMTDNPIGRGYGSSPAIYGLGTKGANLLAKELGIDSFLLKDIVERNKVGSPFLRHALEIANFRVILELACRETGNEVEIPFWVQGQILRDSVSGLNEKGEEERFSIYPDAFFAVSVKGKGTANYFLELDRGTMPIISSGKRADIRKKILGFWHYNKQKKHNIRYYHRTLPTGQIVGLGVNDDSLDEVKGIQGFRVLFLTPGDIDSKGNPSGRIANILSAFNQLKSVVYQNTSLYWLAPLDRFSIESPQGVFSRTWIRPNISNGLGSLIE